jgi:hypothetical protein
MKRDILFAFVVGLIGAAIFLAIAMAIATF